MHGNVGALPLASATIIPQPQATRIGWAAGVGCVSMGMRLGLVVGGYDVGYVGAKMDMAGGWDFEAGMRTK